MGRFSGERVLVQVAILGNGITGISAAVRLRSLQPNWKITVISGESTYHYSRPALMYIFMGDLNYQDTKPYPDSYWAEQRIELLRDWVTEIDFEQKRLRLHRGAAFSYDKLLLAVGSRPNRFGWPGQELRGVQGLYGLQDLSLLIENCKVARQAVLVGGGLIGIELAEMLHSRGLHVSFLVRESNYWGSVLPPEESAMVSRRIRSRGIDLKLNTQLAEILDNGAGRVCAVMTDHGDRLACELVGLTAGVSPNLDLVLDTALKTARGIVVDRQLRTNLPDVFAAGDCAEIHDPQSNGKLLQQVWYTGRMQGEAAADAMAGQGHDYEPGIWYNSAKFFELEFQTYGKVAADIGADASLYWEHPSGEQSIRIAHTAGRVIGFNFMGVRARHRVCEAWIQNGAKVEQVLAEFERAHFDAEFQRRYESDLRHAFAAQWQREQPR